MKLFIPEIGALAMIGVFFVLTLIRSEEKRDYAIALVMSGLVLLLCVLNVAAQGSLFSGVFRADLFSQVFKALLAAGLFLVVCLCSDLSGVEKKRHGEFYLLLATCTLSMMLLASSVHLLAIYVSLELSSYSLYMLVFFRKGKNKGIESSIKYFINGAAASAIMLLGLALLYGSAGTAWLDQIQTVLPSMAGRPMVLVGLILTFCGFFFKLALFPFHFWAPDVYEGAPHQSAAFISTVSKVAAIALLIRLAALTDAAGDKLVMVLIWLSIISMTLGNVSAIVQKDFKRLLAFSSVAHAGYVMVGILSMNPAGYASAVFYGITLLILKFTCFMVVVHVSENGKNVRVEDLAGLHRRAPILAMALMLALFGLAGIPPTIGFTGKLLIFTAAMQNGYFYLVLIAMINVVISLYYYLMVLRAAYLLEPDEKARDMGIRVSTPMNVLACFLIFVTIAGGMFPNPLIEMARAAVALVV